MATEVLQLTGVKETRKAIKAASPTVLKALDKSIRDAINTEVRLIRVQVPIEPPLSGWSTWDGAAVQKAIKPAKSKNKRTPTGYVQSRGIKNYSKNGVIFEMAGRSSSGKTASGQNFVSYLNGRHGQASRLVWRVMDNGGAVRIQTAIKNAYIHALDEIEKDLNNNHG